MSVIQLQGAISHSTRTHRIQVSTKGLACTDFVRQCDRWGIHQQQGGSSSHFVEFSNSSLGCSRRQWNLNLLQAYCRSRQYDRRHPQPDTRPTQPDAPSKFVPVVRTQVGSAHNRPLCYVSKLPITQVQFPFLGTTVRGGGCSGSKLAGRKQFCQSSLGANPPDHRQNSQRTGNGHVDCTNMAKPTLVPQAQNDCSRRPCSHASTQKHSVVHGSRSRTNKEQGVEHSGLASIWSDRLIQLGWSERAIKQSMLALAQSTHLGYDRVLGKCKHYTESSGTHFPPTHMLFS